MFVVSLLNIFKILYLSLCNIDTLLNRLLIGGIDTSGNTFFISLTHKLSNTGPKIGPCGAPNFEYKRFEHRESICTKWLLFDK